MLFHLVVVIVAIVVVFLVIRNLTRQIASILASYYPKVLFNVKTNQKVVALSIDDAPNTPTTHKIADILDTYGAKATFFVIGDHIKQENRAILTRLLNSGHELGNHTFHDKASVLLPYGELLGQIRKTENLMIQCGWKKGEFKWFRPGCGYFTSKMVDLVKEWGYDFVLGNIYPHDPHFPFPRLNAFFILNKVKNGDIIIIHDRVASLELLSIILPALQKRGYRITTISNLVKSRN
jgi:peptidoglycan/xylan/chitin deacetylase (PgdA/CDA1 family)